MKTDLDFAHGCAATFAYAVVLSALILWAVS
jgi:hypothetical protein